MSVFKDHIETKIRHYLTRYETKRSAILPILHVIQDEYGWICNKHIQALEDEFGLLKIQVREVATFYSMYRLKQPKPFRIYFCENVVCHIMGAKPSMEKIKQRIGSNKDSPFSLEGVPCLGVCDGAPAMLVNKDRYLHVNSDKIDAILAKYENKQV